ncbi:MAG: hypothetical protein AB1742_11300 [bacterium]
MSNPFSRLAIAVHNRMRRAVQGPPFDPNVFQIVTPDEEINRRLLEGLNHLSRMVCYPVGYRFRSRWVSSVEGKTTANALETILASLTLRYFDPQLALDAVRCFFVNQSLEGVVPSAVSPMSASSVPSAPLLLLPALKCCETTGGRDDLAFFYNRSVRFSDWLSVHKKREDGLFHPGGREDLAEGFTLFPPAAAPSGAALENHVSAALNFIMVYHFRMMSLAARRTGSPRDGRKFEARARKLAKAVVDACWDDARRDFFDVTDGTRAAVSSPAALLALPGEVVDRKKAEILTAKLETLAAYNPSTPSRMLSLYLLLEGLGKYGFHAAASNAASNALKNVVRCPKSARNLFLAAASLPILLENVIGFYKYHDRYVIKPGIPDQWKERRIGIVDRAARRAVYLVLRETGAVECRILREGAVEHEAEIRNFSFRNFVFSDRAAGNEVRNVPDAGNRRYAY